MIDWQRAIQSISRRRLKLFESCALASDSKRNAQMHAWPHRFVQSHASKVTDDCRASVISERPRVSARGIARCRVLYVAISHSRSMMRPSGHGRLIALALHLVWIGTVCGKLKTRFSLLQHPRLEHLPGPALTEQNKADLTRCAEDILLAREAHFPATIADLYDPETMPDDLRAAHERNDEALERIYIGRRFRNDTERLEKLFELYTKMTAKRERQGKAARRRANAMRVNLQARMATPRRSRGSPVSSTAAFGDMFEKHHLAGARRRHDAIGAEARG